MPFRAQKSLLNLDEKSIEAIDTRNVIDLHGLWSVFHKCADAMENGKRLENLSWRLFSREAFCCAPDLSLSQLDGKRQTSSLDQIPELSSSLDSNSSSEVLHSTSSKELPTSARPELIRKASAECGTRKEKHITSVDLEKIVVSIKSRQELAPLSPLPPALVPSEPVVHTTHETTQSKPVSKRDSTPQPQPHLPPTKSTPNPHYVLDSSTSTVATDDFSDMSPPLAGSETTGTDVSATSIVRGFSKDHISCSARSHSQLLPTPTPSGSILKNSLAYRSQASQPSKKKGATFQLGGSSGECESSFESSYMHGRSSLSDGIRLSKKTTSFKDDVSNLDAKPRAKYQDAAVFDESDDEEDEQSSSAIEEDDMEEEWEDDDEQSAASSPHEREMFQRVDSKPNLVSRRSLITSMMHEKDRATALQNAASRSTPAIRRSRTTSPNGPLNSSPHTSIAQGLEASRARPIIMTTSNIHPPALSPRTTRRNMLSTELTESLRKHLLWDRQVNRSTTNAALKRRHTAQDMTKIQHFPGENHPQTYLAPKVPQSVKSSWNHNYFDSGLQEYHQKGW